MPGQLTSRNWGALQKKRAARRRRHKWLIRTIYGYRVLCARMLWAEHTALHPDEAVSYETVRKDLHALRDTERQCPFCRRPLQLRNMEVMRDTRGGGVKGHDHG